MLFPYYYLDITFLVIVIPAMIYSLYCQFRVKSTFNKMSRIHSYSGLTGAQAAYRVLQYYGITDVRIERSSGGGLSDHYDPRSNVIRLSDDVYNNASIAAIGVACHEAGHAAQHANGYVPIKVRNAILPVCNIGSTLGLPLVILGYFLAFEPLITFGLLLYALIAVFQLVTLPVEFNASSRAIAVIDETGMLQEDEQQGAKKVLRAAAMTYVAALVVSLANLLRLFLRFGNRNNR